MESSAENEVALVFRFFRVYKDGRVELLEPNDEKIPPSDDPITGVRSKDVIFSVDPPLSARLFLPRLEAPNRKSKFPVLLYVHGSGFCMRSPFSPIYDRFCSSVAAEADCIVVSIEYGLFPARPLPACYEDSWAGLQWIASHVHGNGSEPWLNDHADFSKVFMAGNSSGGNICHILAARLGSIGLPGEVKVEGMILVQPFFGGVDKDDMWLYMFPGSNGGSEDHRLKPTMEDLRRLGCKRVLIFVAEEDFLKPAGTKYSDKLKESGWEGSVELVEHQKVDHSFHFEDPNCDMALKLKEKFVSFLKH